VSDAKAASDTAQKIGRILFFVRCWMRLLHPTLKITVCVNTPLTSFDQLRILLFTFSWDAHGRRRAAIFIRQPHGTRLLIQPAVGALGTLAGLTARGRQGRGTQKSQDVAQHS
jgi:hypothetical protein